MAKVEHVTVTQDESGQKLFQFLQRRLGQAPKSAVMRIIRTGQVRVDKKRAKPFDRITAGQMVRIPPFTPEQSDPVPANLPPLEIVHRANDFLALAKPAGLPSTGGTGQTDSVAARLAAMHPDAAFAPTLVHRLDRDTSGLMLAATSYDALRALQKALGSEATAKVYLCWVRGAWPPSGKQPLTDRLDTGNGKRGEVMQTVLKGGKHAESVAICLRHTNDSSLLAVRLVTGRKHQIRVQLSSRGHPILGDFKYGGGKRNETLPAPLLLHAAVLRLEHETITLAPTWTDPFAILDDDMARAAKL